MSITTTNELRNSQIKQRRAKTAEIGMDAELEIRYEIPLTVSVMVKTLLEIIKVKKDHTMDEETRKQFPAIAKEINLLAEQTQ